MVALQEVVKVITQQGKAIGELTPGPYSRTLLCRMPAQKMLAGVVDLRSNPGTQMIDSLSACAVKGLGIWLETVLPHVNQVVHLLLHRVLWHRETRALHCYEPGNAR